MKVSLNRGLVTIQLKPANSANLEQIRKAVTDQGFNPKGSKVTAVGDLTASNGKWQFEVKGTKDVLPVIDTSHARWEQMAGETVVVKGVVQKPASPNQPGRLRIASVSKQLQK